MSRRLAELPRPEIAQALAREGLRSLHVETASRGASVTLDLDGSEVAASCTCGAPAPCAHVSAALAALGAAGLETAAEPEAAAPLPAQPVSEAADARAASAALCAAVASAGLVTSPAVTGALAQLAKALEVDYRPDARRAYGRLADALEHRKLRKAAQTLVKLAGIARSGGDPERRSEVPLVEVGRDTGSDSLGRWDEIYFLDLARGDLLVEGAMAIPGSPGWRELSTGPFPRVILGQLVDIHPGPHPRRVRMIQYEPRGAPSREDVDRIVGHALPGLDSVRERAAEGTSLVLARVARLGTLESEPAIVDDRGRALPLAHGARALTAALVDLAEDGVLRAVLGRAGVAPSGGLQIRPIAAVVDHRLVRLA
ncbi:MAG: hypothetical protein HYY06_29265 [Deltaproteobacteria bacterium]|nr:hypothetical protein [Deltaproteobacteria bacterium]